MNKCYFLKDNNDLYLLFVIFTNSILIMLVRRIRKGEIKQLEDLCNDDNLWSKYFSSHNLWVAKAIEEVKQEKRVVFGGFKSHFGEGDGIKLNLVACIFLKISQFEDSTVEFKNLIVPSNRTGINNEALEETHILIGKAIRFCEVRGIKKIEIELPQEEYRIISIFLSYGFKIVALRERYNPANLICVLERFKGNVYYGDPFDVVKFGSWLLQSYVPCGNYEVIPENNLFRIPFTLVNNTNSYLYESRSNSAKRLSGTLWIMEDETSFEESSSRIVQNAQSAPEITMLLSRNLSSDQKTNFEKNGIIVFDDDDCKEIAGGSLSTLSIPINEDEVGGIVSVLEYEKIIEYSNKKTLTYYLLSGLHSGLSLYESDEDERLLLVIYCPNWLNNTAGVVGCCLINQINRFRLNELIENKIPEDSALSKEDLSFYGAYSKRELIAQLKCTQLALFKDALPVKEGDWINNEEIREYLDREINRNISNSAYLNFRSCTNLKSLMRKKSFLNSRTENTIFQSSEKRFKVGLSFAGEEREFVREVSECLINELGENSVFYDDNYIHELSRLDLDVYLGNLYRNDCELLVPFFSLNYETKNWCNLEWRYMRDIIFNRKDKGSIMPFKFDEVDIEGLLSTDGYIMINSRSPEDISHLIIRRLRS